MSGPVSLRICCIAAMAPALTEAATQARVKLPLCPPSAEPGTPLLPSLPPRLADLVIERSGRPALAAITAKDLHQLVNGDHLHQDLVHDNKHINIGKDDKSKLLALGGKFLDLRSIVNLPQVLGEQLSECLDASELVKMNQPIRLFVNGSSKMTVTDCPSPPVQGEVVSSDKGAGLLKTMDISEETDGGGGDEGTADQGPEPGNSGSGDAPVDSPPRVKTRPQDLLQDVGRRQHLQERRAQRLLRRLRRLQSRQAQAHISSQLGEYVSYHHHNLETMAQNIKTSAQQSPTNPVPGTSQDFTPDMLSSDKIKSLSTAALVNLVRKLQSANSPMSLRQRTTQAETPTTLLRMNKSVRVESERAAEQMIYNLRHVERDLDSDATESSSGGESGDEYYAPEPLRRMEPSNYVNRSSLWQWSRDRAQVAARWTWLQAQVSDLEYRIRTQSDVYRQLRASKGHVHLTERESSKTSSSSISSSPANLNNILSNMDRQASHVTSSLGPLTPQATPPSGGTPLGSPNKRTPNGMLEEDLPAARCRPSAPCRRRRLFRTRGLYTSSRKAARLSTLSCRCYPPGESCALCMGRYNHVTPLDADMARNEKIAILDPSYHPVLSFPEDVPLPVVLEPLVRTTPGLQKASPRYLGRSPSDKTNKYRKKYQRSGQTKSKKLKKSAANLLSMKYKTRYTERASSPAKAAGGKRRADSTRGLSRAELRKRKKLKLAMKRDRRSTPASRAGSTQASPRDSPLPSGHRDVKNWLKKKPETTSYDIDNIVIPHSIAASTRVEKLEYKEIITPKWRLKPVEPITSLSIHEEDLTDDMFASRHVICEVREKQRYLHFVTSGRKKGGSMRAESGANTPDPFSTADEGPTPPVTPSPVEARRRSSSVTRSRAQSMCETTTPTSRTSCATPDPEEVAGPFIPAWEPRKFPLSEAQYQVLVKEKQTAKSPSKRQRKTVTYYDEYVESGQTSVATTPGSSRMASPMSTDNEDEGEAAELVASDPEWDDNEEED